MLAEGRENGPRKTRWGPPFHGFCFFWRRFHLQALRSASPLCAFRRRPHANASRRPGTKRRVGARCIHWQALQLANRSAAAAKEQKTGITISKRPRRITRNQMAQSRQASGSETSSDEEKRACIGDQHDCEGVHQVGHCCLPRGHLLAAGLIGSAAYMALRNSPAVRIVTPAAEMQEASLERRELDSKPRMHSQADISMTPCGAQRRPMRLPYLVPPFARSAPQTGQPGACR